MHNSHFGAVRSCYQTYMDLKCVKGSGGVLGREGRKKREKLCFSYQRKMGKQTDRIPFAIITLFYSYIHTMGFFLLTLELVLI